MKRTDDADKATDLFGSGKHGFQDYDPGVSAGTTVDATVLNHTQEELCRLLEAAGHTPGGGSYYSQVLASLRYADLQRYQNTRSHTTPGSANLNGMASVPGSYGVCAVGNSAAIYRLNTSGAFVTATAAGGFASTFNGVIWAGPTFDFVLFGVSEEIQTMTEVGGSTAQRNTGGTDPLKDAAWDPVADRVVVVGLNNTIWESTTPATWTDRTANSALTGSLVRIFWSATLSLFICYGQGGIQTSPDGITWTQRSSLAVADGIWVDSAGIGIAAVNSGNFHFSTDGITWTDTTVANVFTLGSPSMMGCSGGFIIHLGSFFYRSAFKLGSAAAVLESPTRAGLVPNGFPQHMSSNDNTTGWVFGSSGEIESWPTPLGLGT